MSARHTDRRLAAAAGDADPAEDEPVPRPTAVFAPTHSWNTTVQVSSHHLARTLARRGWRVIFLATPVSPWHALARRSDITVRQKLGASRRGMVEDAEGVLSYVPMTLLPHTCQRPFDNPFCLHHWQAFTLPRLRRKLRQHRCHHPELLIVDNVVMAWLLDELQPRKSVYRITDRYAAFATTTAAMNAAERAFAPRVDLVVYTARHLEAYAEALQPRAALCVEHAVDVAFFETAEAPLPAEYAAIAGPRAVFVGVIGEWFDVAAVNGMARRLPEVAFVIIGPDQGPGRGLADLPNLHVLGPRPHATIPAYLKHAQIGLIPFDRTGRPELVDAINPLKLYEYLICGLPVVTTDWAEMRRLEAPVLACRTEDDFVGAIRRVLAGNAPSQAVCRAYARRADWRKRVDDLLTALALDRVASAAKLAS